MERFDYHGRSARKSADTYGTFTAAAGAKDGETVVMLWIEWTDKHSRDEGMEKVTADPRMQFNDQKPVFDGSRLIEAGFRSMLDHSGGA